jgi:hypothetical protein
MHQLCYSCYSETDEKYPKKNDSYEGQMSAGTSDSIGWEKRSLRHRNKLNGRPNKNGNQILTHTLSKYLSATPGAERY